MKRCSRCKEEKPLDAFNRMTSSKDGKHRYCRVCNAAYLRDYYAANPERQKAAAQEWAEANRSKSNEIKRQWKRRNPQQSLVDSARRRARKAGALFIPMTPREIRRLYSQPCAYCGTTENLHRDHIIPLARGGPDTFGNSQMLCGSCNSSKGTRHNADARIRNAQRRAA